MRPAAVRRAVRAIPTPVVVMDTICTQAAGGAIPARWDKDGSALAGRRLVEHVDHVLLFLGFLIALVHGVLLQHIAEGDCLVIA